MKRNIFIFAFMVMSLMSMAQQWTGIISDTPETFRTQLISSSERSIQVNVQVPGFYTNNVTTPRGEAKIISMPKAVSTAKAGEPNLPMTGIPAIIGDQARMSIRVVEAQYRDFENIEVAPSKGDFPRTIDPATVPYTYGECYSQDAFFPASNVGLYEPYIVRDFRGQNMVIYPFAYNPVTKTLRVYYNMTVEMFKVDDRGTNVMEPRRSNVVKMDQDFKSLYQRHFINYQATMSRYTPLDEEGDLLIICYDNFISSMTDFVNWKKTRGVNTTIVGTSTISSSLTYSNLKTYIQNQYTANNNITHVLLVGDVAQIPGYSYSGGGSDYSGLGDNAYGQVVGNDIYNDLFIGRFSAQNTTQVTNQVQKIINYERDLTNSDTWCQNGLGVSTTSSANGHYNEIDYQHIENLRTDLLAYGYSTVYQDYYGVSGYPSSSTTTISNHINSGVGIINYCNHGSETSWGSHSYSNSHVNALTNSDMLPFVFSVACLNGKYDYSGGDCFAETWMHATNNTTGAPTGAVGTMMSYISQPWVPPMWAQDEFVDILVESYNDNIKHTWGGAAINGIMAILDNYSTSNTSAVGTYQAWVLYGDPTLMLRTKTPQAMNVTHEGVIPVGSSSYVINVSNGNGALATITDANHNILGSATVSNGTANVSINGTITPGTELTLCVFGYNKVTYLGTISVITLNGPYIALDSYTPTIALVGEVTNLSLTFKNLGTSACTGTTNVTLSSSDSNNVTVLNGTGSFGTLAANATTTVSGFRFRFNSGVTLGSSVAFHYTAVNGSNTWEGNFSITPNQIFTVTVAANNADYGTVTGGGDYNYGQSCTVIATPADGYMFTNWTNNGVVVSTDATYTFNVMDNTNLVANFAEGVMIGSGTDKVDYLPGYSYYTHSLTEQIYTPAELGGAGFITSIAFYNGGAEKTLDFEFYMKATTKNNFASKTDWITVTAADKVFSGRVTMVADDWTTISFSTPFVYDGTSNVVLVTDKSTQWTSSPHMSCRVFSTSSNQALYIYDDNTDYTPLSPPTSSTSYNAVLSQKNQLIVTKESFSDCMMPTQLTATEVGPDFVKLSWAENGTATEWMVVYGDNSVTATTNQDFLLEGLEPETEYTITVRPVCNENLVSSPITITTLEACPTPKNVEVSHIIGNAAMVTWDGYNDSYDVQLGLPAFMVSEDFENGIPAGWSNNATYPWTIVDGHIQSGNAGVANSTSSISVTVTYPAAGTISFDFWSRGEGTNDSYDWDKCRFYIDDELMFDYGSHSAWEFFTAEVAAGAHTFTWTYKKDGSVNPAGDCFMVDNVEMKSGEIEWNEPVSVEAVQNAFRGLTPETTYCVRVQGFCDGNETDWSEIVTFTTTELTEVTQTIVLTEGYNWVSFYVEEEDPIELLDMLKASLGDNGLSIEANGMGTIYDGVEWFGALDYEGIYNEQMYLIEVSDDCTIELQGSVVDPVYHVITINPGYNWIGFTGSEEVSVVDALADFEAEDEDMIEGPDGVLYYWDEWSGDFETFVPGQGYMYYSNSTTPKTLVFQLGSSKAKVE